MKKRKRRQKPNEKKTPAKSSTVSHMQSVRFPHRHRKAPEKSENRNDCPNELAAVYIEVPQLFIYVWYGYGQLLNIVVVV